MERSDGRDWSSLATKYETIKVDAPDGRQFEVDLIREKAFPQPPGPVVAVPAKYCIRAAVFPKGEEHLFLVEGHTYDAGAVFELHSRIVAEVQRRIQTGDWARGGQYSLE